MFFTPAFNAELTSYGIPENCKKSPIYMCPYKVLFSYAAGLSESNKLALRANVKYFNNEACLKV